MNTERHGVSSYQGIDRTACGTVRDRSLRTPTIRADTGASRKYGVSQSVPRGKTPYRCSCSILRLESRVEKIRLGNTSNYSALLHFGTNFAILLVIIIPLCLNNVQQSMGKPGTQAQLIKTRILYSRSREKSVLVL